MKAEIELHEIGFVKKKKCSSIHIGGPWYLHAFFLEAERVSLLYGNKDPFDGDQVSIWATFTDIGKLKDLIQLLKGEKDES